MKSPIANWSIRLSIFVLLAILLIGQTAAQSENQVLARLEVAERVASIQMPIYAHLQDASLKDYVLVITDISELDRSENLYEVLDFVGKKLQNESYFIALERIKGARQKAQEFVTVLHDDGKHIVFRATETQAEALASIGFELEEISTPLVIQETRSQVRGISYDSAVAGMIDKVQQDTLYKYVGQLSGETPVTVGGSQYTIVSRYTKSGEPIAKATQYAYEWMQKLGLDVSYHEWSSPSRNVIGNKLGTTKPKEIVLVVGHFDSAPSSSTNSPGADDNASGSAGVLLTAEILCKYNFERTIRFVLFTGEEQGLYGSRYYADKVYQAGENVVAVYNMDMISWDSDNDPTLRLHVRTTSNSGHAADKAIAEVFSQVVTTYKLNLKPIIDADGESASDHSSFWKKGYPGILAIEDDSSDFCKNYHTSRDKLATINMGYYTNYVKATVGTVAHMSYLGASENIWALENYAEFLSK